ncbi:MAG TPA: hypothetical protein VEH26_06305 [Chthoniobacterales bacterium]|nr:hypothetical protein [Chthoniobacterales bacterium]
MSTQTLKDGQSNIIGYIETHPDGTQIAKDSHYNIKGYYDPTNHRTIDTRNNIMGSGNLLAALLGWAYRLNGRSTLGPRRDSGSQSQSLSTQA